MTRAGYTPAMLRRHPGLREPWRPTWGGILAIALLLCVAMLFASCALRLI